eukprot:TRINITY_DN5362_c0_g1_i1.p1 TRINITY_DN5362_c0_g1~~TRINITY_DN5362_c0_g1_i1.p1  ORF type:complete len:269 (-),score=58.68 TRINITY_DN5362_c0_g1_i1:643-1449(-)
MEKIKVPALFQSYNSSFSPLLTPPQAYASISPSSSHSLTTLPPISPVPPRAPPSSPIPESEQTKIRPLANRSFSTQSLSYKNNVSSVKNQGKRPSLSDFIKIKLLLPQSPPTYVEVEVHCRQTVEQVKTKLFRELKALADLQPCNYNLAFEGEELVAEGQPLIYAHPVIKDKLQDHRSLKFSLISVSAGDDDDDDDDEQEKEESSSPYSSSLRIPNSTSMPLSSLSPSGSSPQYSSSPSLVRPSSAPFSNSSQHLFCTLYNNHTNTLS